MKFRNFWFEISLVVMAIMLLMNDEVSGDNHSRVRQASSSQEENRNAGNPLFLTPLIEDGQLDEARNKAKVVHLQMLTTTSYAGFLTVNKTYNSNLFFWYFPAKVDSANAPVLLYLEGGPGVTGLFGLFLINGPWSVTAGGSLNKRKEAWTDAFNVIYVDNPVGTGFSFTEYDDGYPRGQIQIGEEMRIAMAQFFQMFPNLRKNDFYVTGESYAGKFVPATCYAIHLYNPNAEHKINLKGMAVSDGYTDPVNQLSYGDHFYSLGLVDENGRQEFLDLEKRLKDLVLEHKHTEAYDLAGDLVTGEKSLFRNLTGYRSPFNILLLDDPIRVDPAFKWIERTDVRRALHVGNTPFKGFAPKVAEFLKDDATHSQANLITELLDNNYRVLLYAGALDLEVGYWSVQNLINNLKWDGLEEFKNSTRKQWKVNDDLAGYSKTSGNLTDVYVRNAGHIVHVDQPVWGLELLKKFTKGQEI